MTVSSKKVMLTFTQLLVNWPKPYISGTDLHHILDKSTDGRYSFIKRAVQKGLLRSIRKDLYLINDLNHKKPDAFELAPIVYGPSYISFESALSYHGWIPEGVRTITSATLKRSKEFETPLGVFSYESIPIHAYPKVGIEQKPQDGFMLFIASPVRALADFIYSRKRVWVSIEDLEEDLRIDRESFMEADIALIKELMAEYASPRVKNALAVLYQGLME